MEVQELSSSNKRIAEIAARCEAATPGPWKHEVHHTKKQTKRILGVRNMNLVPAIREIEAQINKMERQHKKRSEG